MWWNSWELVIDDFYKLKENLNLIKRILNFI